MTLYTAIGRYELGETAKGEKRPHIHVGDNEFELDVQKPFGNIVYSWIL